MELDNRAINFIQNAKAQGYSKEEVAKFLQDKGYDIGEQPQDNYSALDKAKYMGRAGAEGLTFGLGDIVAGATNVFANDLADITHGKDFKTRLKGLGRSYYRALNPASIISDDNFKQGRKEFVTEQEQFAQAHPWLNLGGELAGGLVTGIGSAGKGAVKALAKPTIGAMIKGGAKSGAKFGALYGLGSGFTEDADRLSVANALKGAGVGTLSGAVLGAALPVGIAGVVAGGKYLGRPLVTGGKKVADYFRNKTINTLTGANKGLVEQSIKEGKPLIDIADQKLMDVAEGANLINREAKQTFADYGKARIEGQHSKLVDTLGEHFNPKGSHQLLDELNANVQEGAKTLYDKAKFVTDKAGNIVVDDAGKQVGKVLPELEKLNKYEMDYISQVYRTKGLEYEVQGLPQNDMRILDYAKQLMDDDIQQLLNKGKNRQAAILAEKRASFISKIDKANPEYKTARNFFERGKRAENALQAGKNALTGERENLAYDFNKLTPEEKFYFRQGVGNKLEELSNQKSEGGNIFQKVFNAENRRRLKGLDIKNYADLEKKVLAESKAASNINSLRGGSPTADRLEAIKRFALGVIRRPTRTVTNVLANTAFKPFYANPAEVAKAMTDPVFLAKLYTQAEKNGGKGAGKSVIEALNQIGRMAGGTAEDAQSNLNIRQILNDATKPIKNKGGYLGEKPKINDVLQYANEPFAKNETSLNNFRKWSDNAPFVKSNEEALSRPFKTGEKVVVKAYHGTQRADRVGNVFQPNRATSGPMPMFSSSEEVAQGYMRNKTDTSIRANEDISYENWFRIKNKGKETKLDEAWYKLSPKQREEIAQKAPHITEDSDALNIIYDPNNSSGLGGYKYHLEEANGNHLKALVDEWLNSGSLYGREEEFAEVLKKIGLKDSQFVYDNPNAVKGAVFNTYIQFKKPLVTTDIPQNVITKLEEVAKKQPIPDTRFGVDLWDKNTRHPIEWVKTLKEDYKNGKNSFAWSSIPDWVTNVLKDFGYDGIIDEGGKGVGNEIHRVYIPFKSNQIKSVNNKGTFSKRSNNIYKALIGGVGISQILKNKENK